MRWRNAVLEQTAKAFPRIRYPSRCRFASTSNIKWETSPDIWELWNDANANTKRKGLRLQDYVNNHLLEIDMPRNYQMVKHGNKFNYKDPAVPKELQELQPDGVDMLETVTILAMHIERRIAKGNWAGSFLFVSHRLAKMMDINQVIQDYMTAKEQPSSANESLIFRTVAEHGYSMEDFKCWLNCITASKLSQAILSMRGRRWPAFLVMFTLRRRSHSRREALLALHVYQQCLHGFPKGLQMGFFVRTQRIVQKWLIECVPDMCRAFLKHADKDVLCGFTFNQLLWSICGFGRTWNRDDALILSDAMKPIFNYMSSHGHLLDTKGYLAIAYVTYFSSPEKSRAIVQQVREHKYPASHEEAYNLEHVDAEHRAYSLGRIPYTHGLYALELLHSRTFDEAINYFQSIPENRQNSIIWAILLLKLRELNCIDDELIQKLWATVVNSTSSVSPYLVEQFVQNAQDASLVQTIINEASTKKDCIIKLGVVRSLLEKQALTNLDDAIQIFTNLKSRSPQLYAVIMSACSNQSRSEQMWPLYTKMLSEGIEPDVEILLLLCKAGCNMGLKWDGAYAAQRAVLEFKQWVRGALADGSDANDIIKIYPSPALFEAYILLIGKAGYTQELLAVLPWMDRIQFVASKRSLCALIKYAPNGPYLLKLGQTLGGQWPTEHEYEAYNEAT